MKTEHPITPPPEMVREWARYQGFETPEVLWRTIATQAARWGADQELKACCEWLLDHGYDLCSPEMRKDRRPKPPSLKEQALQALASADGADHPVVATVLTADQHLLIRRALEALPDV